MDSAVRNGAALRKQIDQYNGILLRNFENILTEAYGSNEIRQERTDLSATMDRGFEIHLYTQQLVRASEDLMALVRQMQELWLFGTLDPVDTVEDEQMAEEEERDTLKLEDIAHNLLSAASHQQFDAQSKSQA